MWNRDEMDRLTDTERQGGETDRRREERERERERREREELCG